MKSKIKIIIVIIVMMMFLGVCREPPRIVELPGVVEIKGTKTYTATLTIEPGTVVVVMVDHFFPVSDQARPYLGIGIAHCQHIV